MNRRLLVGLIGVATLLGACGDSNDVDPSAPVTVRLLTYEGFVLPPSAAAFSQSTGISIELVTSPDAGTLVNKAILAAGNPEGDVLWGLDTTLLSRALANDVFTPYASNQLDTVSDDARALVPGHEVTPVDTGDVCLNVDDEWFATAGIEPPRSFDELADPTYRDLFVMPDPALSTPGLAIMLATVAAFGEDGYIAYWERLHDNGMLVVDSWSTAYFTEFTAGGGGGNRPIVVSYASSPPFALVAGPDPKPTKAPTSAVLSTCFRQVEFAGILRGSEHVEAAQAVIDLFLSQDFQAELPESNFVYPVRDNIDLPKAFASFGRPADEPLSVTPGDIAAHRDEWIEAWNAAVR